MLRKIISSGSPNSHVKDQEKHEQLISKAMRLKGYLDKKLREGRCGCKEAQSCDKCKEIWSRYMLVYCIKHLDQRYVIQVVEKKHGTYVYVHSEVNSNMPINQFTISGSGDIHVTKYKKEPYKNNSSPKYKKIPFDVLSEDRNSKIFRCFNKFFHCVIIANFVELREEISNYVNSAKDIKDDLKVKAIMTKNFFENPLIKFNKNIYSIKFEDKKYQVKISKTTEGISVSVGRESPAPIWATCLKKDGLWVEKWHNSYRFENGQTPLREQFDVSSNDGPETLDLVEGHLDFLINLMQINNSESQEYLNKPRRKKQKVHS